MKYFPSVLRPQGRDRVHNLEDGLSGSTLPMAFGAPTQAALTPMVQKLSSFRTSGF